MVAPQFARFRTCLVDRIPGRQRCRSLLRTLGVGLLSASLACGGNSSEASSAAEYDPDVARYRLLLRANPVDPGKAFRCYGSCQKHTSPDGYLECLTQCPAFEVTEGIACITARRMPRKEELAPGYKVIAVIANMALIVALGMACTSSPNCGNYYYYVPGQPPLPGTLY